MDTVNAAAIAAHYGSVSAVTFLAAQTFGQMHRHVRGGLHARARRGAGGARHRRGAAPRRPARTHRVAGRAGGWAATLHEVITGRSILLLLGGLAIGYVADPVGMATVDLFFVGLFPGVLTLFLLELGMVAARRLRDLRTIGPFLLAFGVLMPVLHGCLGVWVGQLAGLSVGGSAVLGAMVGSASYIAAPAAVRVALPQANPAFYLTRRSA
jgi:uncharacterized protein